MVQTQALVISMKEIWLVAACSIGVIADHSYKLWHGASIAIFPKWSTVRRVIKHIVVPPIMKYDQCN